MNPDESRNRCDAPEEQSKSEVGVGEGTRRTLRRRSRSRSRSRNRSRSRSRSRRRNRQSESARSDQTKKEETKNLLFGPVVGKRPTMPNDLRLDKVFRDAEHASKGERAPARAETVSAEKA